jgi:hypothetical protein
MSISPVVNRNRILYEQYLRILGEFYQFLSNVTSNDVKITLKKI